MVKNAVKEIAWSKGRAVTFMAKHDSRAAGSSCHVHQSLRGLDGQAAFHDAGEPHGMSKPMRHWVAGLLAHAAEITWFLAPYVNSYKRFVAGTFAPTRPSGPPTTAPPATAWWARTRHSVRIECRVGGADLNPHLAYAALIAAGIDGIERGLELEPEFRGDAYGEGGRRDPEDAARRHRGARAARRCCAPRSATRWSSTTCTPPAGSSRESDRRVTDWEVARGFERA